MRYGAYYVYQNPSLTLPLEIAPYDNSDYMSPGRIDVRGLGNTISSCIALRLLVQNDAAN